MSRGWEAVGKLLQGGRFEKGRLDVAVHSLMQGRYPDKKVYANWVRSWVVGLSGTAGSASRVALVLKDGLDLPNEAQPEIFFRNFAANATVDEILYGRGDGDEVGHGTGTKKTTLTRDDYYRAWVDSVRAYRNAAGIRADLAKRRPTSAQSIFIGREKRAKYPMPPGRARDIMMGEVKNSLKRGGELRNRLEMVGTDIGGQVMETLVGSWPAAVLKFLYQWFRMAPSSAPPPLAAVSNASTGRLYPRKNKSEIPGTTSSSLPTTSDSSSQIVEIKMHPQWHFFVDADARVASLVFRGTMNGWLDDWIVNLQVEGDHSSPVYKDYVGGTPGASLWRETANYEAIATWRKKKAEQQRGTYVKLHYGFYRRAAIALAELEIQLRFDCNCGAAAARYTVGLQSADAMSVAYTYGGSSGVGFQDDDVDEAVVFKEKRAMEPPAFKKYLERLGSSFDTLQLGGHSLGGAQALVVHRLRRESALLKALLGFADVDSFLRRTGGASGREVQQVPGTDYLGGNNEKHVETIVFSAPPIFSASSIARAVPAQKYLITGRVPEWFNFFRGPWGKFKRKTFDFWERVRMANTCNIFFENDLVPRLAHLTFQKEPLLVPPVQRQFRLRQQEFITELTPASAPTSNTTSTNDGGPPRKKVRVYRTVFPLSGKAFFVYLSHLDTKLGLGDTMGSAVKAHSQKTFAGFVDALFADVDGRDDDGGEKTDDDALLKYAEDSALLTARFKKYAEDFVVREIPSGPDAGGLRGKIRYDVPTPDCWDMDRHYMKPRGAASAGSHRTKPLGAVPVSTSAEDADAVVPGDKEDKKGLSCGAAQLAVLAAAAILQTTNGNTTCAASTWQPRHLWFTVAKRHRTTEEARSLLAKHLNVGAEAICYGGLKDRRGITFQTFSVRAGAEARKLEKRLRSFQDPNIFVSAVRPAHRHYALGMQQGNHFQIGLRDVRPAGRIDDVDVLSVIRERAAAVAHHGFLNYFGAQRFGRGKILSSDVGRALLIHRDYKHACSLIIHSLKEGAAGDGRSGVNELRACDAAAAYDRGDFEGALEQTPRSRLGERNLLRILQRTNGNYERAFLEGLPRTMGLFYVRACDDLYEDGNHFT
eukprot:g2880.t1